MNYELKTDCFAYSKKNNECRALKELYCEKENCPFYKTKEQVGDYRCWIQNN